MSYKQWVVYDPRPYLKDTLTFFAKYRVDKMWISLLVMIIKLWTTESKYKKPNIHARTWCDRSKTILRFSKCMERAGIIDPGLETTHPGPVFPSWGSYMRTWRWSSWSHSGVRLSFETFHTLMNSGPELSASCVLADYFLSFSQMNSFFFLSFFETRSHWSETCCIDHLPLPPKWQNWRCTPPCPAIHMHFKQVV